MSQKLIVLGVNEFIFEEYQKQKEKYQTKGTVDTTVEICRTTTD